MKPLRCLLGGLLLAGTASAQDFIHQARALRLEAARYEHAQGVPRDYGRAYALYCKAALLGDALAAYSLGWMYFNGRGLSRQAELAVGWFKRAAKAGDVYAARMLLRYGNITGSEDPRCQPEPPPPPWRSTVAEPTRTVNSWRTGSRRSPAITSSIRSWCWQSSRPNRASTRRPFPARTRKA